MQQDTESRIGNIKGRHLARQKWIRPAQISAIIGVLGSVVLLAVVVIFTFEPVINTYILWSLLILLIGGVAIAIGLAKMANKSAKGLSSEELVVLHASEANSGLSTYLKNDSPIEFTHGKKHFGKLISEINSKWGLENNFLSNNFLDTDYKLNPIVKMMAFLRNSKPAIEEKNREKINTAVSFLSKLTEYYLYPSESTLAQLLTFTIPSITAEEKKTPKGSYFSSRPLLKHGMLTAAMSIPAGFLVAYFAMPLAPDDPLKAMQFGLAVAIAVSGTHIGLVKLHAKDK